MACLVDPAAVRLGPPCSLPAWQRILAEAVRDPAELCRLLDLPPAMATEATAAADGFPLCVPRPYLARIRRGDAADPLLRQVLPTKAEGVAAQGFTNDPLDEAKAARTPRLLQKYRGRALLLLGDRCALGCRFCFRRHRPSGAGQASDNAVDEALRHVAADPSLHEVVLSGGDPLVLDDRDLAHLAHRLASIPHLGRLRVHTRLPIAIPQRVTGPLLAWLRGTRLAPVMVVHVNHPAEIDRAVADALGRLVDAGVPLLSQSVLLCGVNDDVEVLAALFERLVDLRVLPYYLHQLDAVAGAAHFETPVARGLELLAQLRARLPGYAVPRYVRETPGAASKQRLA